MNQEVRTRRRVVQTGTIATTREYRDGGDTVSRQDATTKVAAEDIRNPAYVSIKGGVTFNTGNFTSVRVEVMVSMPCLADEEHIRAKKEECAKYVDDFLEEERRVALGEPETPAQVL